MNKFRQQNFQFLKDNILKAKYFLSLLITFKGDKALKSKITLLKPAKRGQESQEANQELHTHHDMETLSY